MVDVASLQIDVRVKNLEESVSGLQRLANEGKKAESANNSLSSSFGNLAKYVKVAAAALGAYKLVEMAKDAALLAARYETLGAVIKNVGNNAGYTGAQMEIFEKGLQRQGIAMMEARQSLIKMAGAQMDLTKANSLARIAQDAAVIGGINSSEAFDRMINGIRSGEVEILKTIGLNVNFQQSYEKIASQLGKNTSQLTNAEKTQARMNAVMEFGINIAGSYEASMSTAGKQLLSMQRYSDDLKIKLGAVFNDVLIVGVQAFTGALKDANVEADRLAREGKMQEWSRTIVISVATIADGLTLVYKVLNTFVTAGVAGFMQLYHGAIMLKRAFDFDFKGAKESMESLYSVGAAWVDMTADSFKDVTKFQDAARKTFADRDRNSAADKAAADKRELEAIARSAKAQTEAQTAVASAKVKYSREDDLLLQNILATEESEKDRLELLQRQRKELEFQLSIIKYIADLEAANNATAASMVGMNSVGGFDSISDQTANATAIQEAAHKSTLARIERERDAELERIKDTVNAEKQSAAIRAGTDKALALERQKNTIATGAIADKSFKSQLSMTSQYTSMAGQLFAELASAQDQTSRSGFETAKAFNIAAAIMSTAAGIMAQFAAPDGALPSAWARAALVGVTGAIQVAKIASTSFGGGGGVTGAPSGSFAASGGASGAGTGISNLPQNISSIQDSRTNESIDRLTASTDNSATVIGKLSKSIDSLSALFEEDGGGYALANNAPNRFTQTSEIATMTGNVMNALGFGSSAVKFFKGDLLGSIKSFGSSLFGGGWQTTGGGIQLGINNGDVAARDYVTSAKSGGLFGKSKSSISYTENSDAAAYMDDLISPYISDLVNMARTLGTEVDTSKYSAAYTNIATAGRKPEDIAKDMEKWFLATLQGMSLTVEGLGDAIGYYDDAYEALKTMNDALVSTNDAFALVGKTALQGSFDNAKYAISLQGLFGGMDGFNTAMDDYFTTMYTDTEQAAMKAAAATIDVNDAFKEINDTLIKQGLATFAIPATNAEFNALRNSIDTTTESGMKLFHALTMIGPTFATMTEAMTNAAQEFTDSILTISQSASDAIRGIQNSALSTESPEARYARLQQEFTNATPEMAGSIAQSFLESSRGMYASGTGYADDYYNVMSDLNSLAALDSTVDPNASTVAEIKTLKQAIVDLQAAIVGKLTDIESPLLRVASL